MNFSLHLAFQSWHLMRHCSEKSVLVEQINDNILFIILQLDQIKCCVITVEPV
jgi:hypothetical protein